MEDVTVGGGTAGAFTRSSATVTTLIVAPPADATGTLTVAVAAMSFEDAAGNTNELAVSASQDFDTMVVGPPQTGIVDFEALTPPTLIGFGGAEDATVVMEPTDATNMVGRVVKNGTAELWAGTTVAYCFGLADTDVRLCERGDRHRSIEPHVYVQQGVGVLRFRDHGRHGWRRDVLLRRPQHGALSDVVERRP